MEKRGEGFPSPLVAPDPNAALFSGDLLDTYLDKALEIMSPSRVLAIVREGATDPPDSLEQYRERVCGGVCVPAPELIRICTGLVKAGVSFEKAALHILTKKNSAQTHRKALLTILSAMSRGSFSGEMFDMVLSGYIAHRHYENIVSNAVLADVQAEWRKGDARMTRLIFSSLDDSTLSWLTYNHALHIVKYYPAIFKEAPAEVKEITRDEIIINDPVLPEITLKLGRRLSLSETAARHGLALREEKDCVTLDGEPIGVPDFHPDRLYNEGIYRMTRDVRVENGRAIVEEPDSIYRPFDALVLASGHRYHLTRSWPVYEFESVYLVRRLRHLVFNSIAISTRKAWRFLGGRKDSDPWADLLFLLDKDRPENLPLPRPRASVSAAHAEMSEEEFRGKLERLRARYGLTAREAEVMEKATQGKSNREIAKECGISEATVKAHMSRILQKTGHKSRCELIARALEK
jgi:DNA-binding CsgD family transcriptional regulator